MAETIDEPIEEQPKIKMSDFELSTYGEMYSQGAMVPMVVPPRRAEDGTPLDGEGEDGHNYSVALSDLDGRIRMYADAAIESSFDAIVAGAATAAEAQIPTKVSELENDAGYATTGAMNAALSRKQDTIQDLSDIRSGAEAGATAVQPGNLATVATSGRYDDLEGKPEIPAAQVNADWNASSGVAAIHNKPDLAAVATTGDYDDLNHKPSIPAAQVNADWNSSTGVSKILNKPELAPVATSGNYSDLAGKPSIPAKTSDLSNDKGFITAADVRVKDVTVNGSSAVNAQGIATITVPTTTSALQNDSGFVGTQSAPSANQVLTFNGSAVVWADPQGGGGSDLPPITPADEGKFLKVESGSAVWGEGGGGDDPGITSIDISEFMSWFIGGAQGTAPDVSGIWSTAFDAMCDGKKVEVFGAAEYGIYRGPCECAIEITSQFGTLKDVIDMLISSGQVSTVEEAKALIMQAFEAGELPSSFVLLPETIVQGYYVDVWKFDLIAPFVEDDTQPTHIHPAYEMTYMKQFPVIGLRMDTIEGTFDNPLKNIELYSAQISSNHGVITGWKYENPYGEESDYKEYLREKCTYSDLYDASQRGLQFAITAPLELEPCTQGTYNYFKSEYIALNVEVDLQFGDGTLTLSVPSVAMAYENGFVEKEIISFHFSDLKNYIGAPKPLMYSSTWLHDEDNTGKVLLQSESVTGLVVAPEPGPEPAPSYEYIILQNFLTDHTIGTPESGTGYSPFYGTYPSDKASIGWDSKWMDTITHYGVTGSIVDTTPGARLVFEDPDSTKRFDFSQYGIALGRLPFGYLDISSNNVKGAAYANVSLPQEFTIEAWYLNTDSYNSYVKFLNLYSASLDKKLEVAASWNNATFASTQIYSNWNAYTPLRSWNHVALTCDGTNLYIFANGTKVGTVVIANVTGLAEFLASTLELRFNEAYVAGSYTYHNATWYAQIAVCKSCKWTSDFKRPYISF